MFLYNLLKVNIINIPQIQYQEAHEYLLLKLLQLKKVISENILNIEGNYKHEFIFKLLFNNRTPIEYNIDQAIKHSPSGCFLLT